LPAIDRPLLELAVDADVGHLRQPTGDFQVGGLGIHRQPRGREPGLRPCPWSSPDTAGAPERLPAVAIALLQDPENTLLFSAASLWEITIKRGLGRADFHVDSRVLRRSLLDNGYEELPITSEHAVFVDSLPDLRKDPFDGILVAQATVEGIALFTSDALVAQYPGAIQKSGTSSSARDANPGLARAPGPLQEAGLQRHDDRR
jgi:PIN domain nuclease of toxin-antitoxin system